jgi:hypothetical protein
MPRWSERGSWRLVAPLGACVFLVACVGVPRASRQYRLDTVSSACLKSPASCPPVVGQSAAATTTTVSGSLVGSAAVGGLLIQPDSELDAETTAAIDTALSDCADEARSEVMLKHFKDGRPTREQCEEVVAVDRRGQPITRAMQLGVEQHEVALRCAQERLSKLKPEGFSVTPRYRIDPRTGTTEYLPREVVEELLRQGRGDELKGTLEPDIVIHEGSPRRVQDVYDYKFPCVNTDRRLPWREYPEGHPSGGRNQGDVYRKALGRPPARVQPRVGVYR